MYISSDSDEENPWQKLQKLKKKLRAKTEPNPDPVIDLCDVSSLGIKPPISNNIYSVNNEVIEVPDVDINKHNDSTRLFLNDSVIVCDDVAESSAKRKSSETDTEIVTPARRQTKRGRGRGKGRGKNQKVADPVTPEPITRNVRGKGKRGRGSKKQTDLPVAESSIVSLPSDNEVNNSFLSPTIPDLSINRRSTRSSVAQQSTRGAAANSTPQRGSRARRRGRNTRSPRNAVQCNYPTYSVGNTDDYPDASSNQTLFTNKESNSPVVDLNESLNNEELSVKVYWQNMKVVKFNIRKLQKLSQIFNHFVKQEGVGQNQLLFTYDSKILRPDDTPETINYNIAKFIEGGIVESGLMPQFNVEKALPKGFMLKFQCQTMKKPFELSVGKDEKLQLAMVKCAEHLELPIKNIRFEFDGETVKGNMTPNDMDMESGDCIDVKILNVNK